MKLAITVWNGRVAPLFDVAKHIMVVKTEGFGKPIGPVMHVALEHDEVKQKIAALVSLGVEAIICGAISREYEEALMDAGIEMDAFVAGDVSEVIDAWQRGRMRQRSYSMPGCSCPRHRCLRRNRGYGHSGQGGGHRFDR